MSIPLNVTCPECGKVGRVSPEFAGRMGICPACKKSTRIPMPSAPRVIEATANPRFVQPTGFRVDPELRNQLMGLAAVVVVVVLFGRDWIQPQPSAGALNK